MLTDQQNPRREASNASGKDVAAPTRDRIRRTAGWLIWGAWVLFGVWIASVSIRTLLWDRAMAANAYSTAIRMRPDLAAAWRWQAQNLALDDLDEARQSAHEACRLNPDNWQNWSTLAQIEYQAGNASEALRALRSAVRVNQGYESHYALASLLLLMGDRAGFWQQMKAALQLVPDDQAYVAVGQALRAEPTGLHPGLVAALPNNPAVEAAAIVALSDRQDSDAALRVWQRLNCDASHTSVCGGAALSLTQVLLRGPHPDVESAASVWNGAVARGWLKQDGVHVGQITDPGFQRRWISVGFGWVDNHSERFDVQPGPVRLGSAQVVRVNFDGYEAPGLQVFRQIVPVRPGQKYSFSISSRRDGSGQQGGISMQVWSLPQRQLLLDLPLDLNSDWGKNLGAFQVPADIHLVAISLEYQRPLGQTLLADPVEVAAPRLVATPSAPSAPSVKKDSGGVQ